jgi:hypothetical protein
MRKILAAMILLSVSAGLLGGCLMAGNYHSAKTLEPGVSSFGTTFSVNAIYEDTEQQIAIPNIIPELTYHIGVVDDLELGGRLALGSLGIEIDAKYRFLQAGGLHLAIAPSVGYMGWVVLQGISTRLPFIATYEINKWFGVNAAIYAGYSHYSVANDDLGDAINDFSGDMITYGVAIGPEISGETFFIRPSVEFTRYQVMVNVEGEDSHWNPFNNLAVMVHLGWVYGREKQQLDRIEKKVDDGFDRIERKLDEKKKEEEPEETK